MALGSESRPLSSKVRSSFIAVEKDGKVGLQRDTSHESSISRRRLSNDTTEGTDTVATSVPEKLEPMPVLGEPIKISPATTPNEPPAKPPTEPSTPAALETAPTSNGAATHKVTDKPATKPVEKVAEKPKPSPAPAAKENAPNRNAASAKVPPAVKKAPEAAPKQEAKPTTTARSNNLTVSKPSTSGSRSPAATSRATTPSPREPKAPNAASSSAAAAKKPTSTVTPKKPTAPAASQKQTPSTSARKPPPIQLSPSAVSGVGFVKPKPKSPTKPVKLPSSLTSHTASSGYKTSTGRLSAGSAGSTGSSQNVRSSARSSSRASGSTASTLRRASSNVSRPRPSVGPPPKKHVQEKPAAGKPNVDEGFLARMMRPTQSSRSKTADKVPVTPPRIAAAQRRPATRQGDGNQRDGSRARGPSRTGRLTSRSVSPSRTSPSKITREATPIPPITEEMAAATKESPQNDAAATLEKSSEVTSPEPQQGDERQAEDTIADEAPVEALAVANEPAKKDPVVADEPAKEDVGVANVTAEVADLKVSEPLEPVAAAIEAIPQDAPSETREADQTETSAADDVKEASETSKTPSPGVENEGTTATDAVKDDSAGAKAEDEQETW